RLVDLLGGQCAQPVLGLAQRLRLRQGLIEAVAFAEQVLVEALHQQRRGGVVDPPQAEDDGAGAGPQEPRGELEQSLTAAPAPQRGRPGAPSQPSNALNPVRAWHASYTDMRVTRLPKIFAPGFRRVASAKACRARLRAGSSAFAGLAWPCVVKCR